MRSPSEVAYEGAADALVDIGRNAFALELGSGGFGEIPAARSWALTYG
ncbi:hypothetical protein ACFXDH_18600 [Streptomyces sp. NPDC059467]